MCGALDGGAAMSFSTVGEGTDSVGAGGASAGNSFNGATGGTDGSDRGMLSGDAFDTSCIAAAASSASVGRAVSDFSIGSVDEAPL